MEDEQIHTAIEQLVREEHGLWQRESAGRANGDDRRRQQQLKVALDQCWDPLRQRRALRFAGATRTPPRCGDPRSWRDTSNDPAGEQAIGPPGSSCG